MKLAPYPNVRKSGPLKQVSGLPRIKKYSPVPFITARELRILACHGSTTGAGLFLVFKNTLFFPYTQQIFLFMRLFQNFSFLEQLLTPGENCMSRKCLPHKKLAIFSRRLVQNQPGFVSISLVRFF
jgi:hypothetical protein